MKHNELTAALRSAQDQDEAAGVDWWNSASPEQRVAVLEAIYAACESHNKVVNIVARFAQVGFTRIALLAEDQ